MLALQPLPARLSAFAVVILLLVAAPLYADSFLEVAQDSGINFAYRGVWGGGVAIEDFDNDGDLDIAMAGGFDQPNRLYENIGVQGANLFPSFVEIGGSAGLVDIGHTKAVVFADYNNDGLADLFCFTANNDPDDFNTPDAYLSPVQLYRNNGDKTFDDVTEEAGLILDWDGQYHGSALADIDNDGWLDLCVGNRGYAPEGGLNRVLHNNQDGTFTDITESAGLGQAQRMSLQVGFFDYDNDGDQDMYHATDKRGGNQLFRNNGNLTFTDVSEASGTDLVMDAMCVTTGDYDHDGDFELYVTNTPDGHAFLENNGDGTFTERAFEAGVIANRIGWGAEWLDFDNDTWLDLYAVSMGNVRENLLFKNNRNRTFTDVALQAGCQDPSSSYGFGYGDFDRNGSLDLLVGNQGDKVTLFLNTGNPGRWLGVKLVGIASNAEGVGARLKLTTGSVVQTSEVHAGSGYLSQSQKEVHFGVGTATTADKLEVLWPSGRRETYENLDTNTRYRIVEGNGIQTETVLLPTPMVVSGESSNTLYWDVIPFPGDAMFSILVVEDETRLPMTPPREIPVAGRHHEFVDTVLGTLEPGSYRYEVSVSGDAGPRLLWTSDPIEVRPPPILKIGQNIPNPFHADTLIPLRVPQDAINPSVRVFDVRGRFIARFATPPGTTVGITVDRNTLSQGGQRVPSGIYYYQLFLGSTPSSAKHKMILLP